MHSLTITKLLGGVMRRLCVRFRDAHPWGWMLDLVRWGVDMMGKLTQAIRSGLAGGLFMLVSIGLLSGCTPLWMSKEVYEQATLQNTLPPLRDLELRGCPVTDPLTPKLNAPATVAYPERTPRPI